MKQIWIKKTVNKPN